MRRAFWNTARSRNWLPSPIPKTLKPVLGKLGLDTREQKADTNYMDGIQGLLNAQNGQQLNLSTLGNSSLAKQVKTKACDLVLKQGVNFLS